MGMNVCQYNSTEISLFRVSIQYVSVAQPPPNPNPPPPPPLSEMLAEDYYILLLVIISILYPVHLYATIFRPTPRLAQKG